MAQAKSEAATPGEPLSDELQGEMQQLVEKGNVQAPARTHDQGGGCGAVGGVFLVGGMDAAGCGAGNLAAACGGDGGGACGASACGASACGASCGGG